MNSVFIVGAVLHQVELAMNLETDPSEILNEIIYTVRPVRIWPTPLNRPLADTSACMAGETRHAAACLARRCRLARTPAVRLAP